MNDERILKIINEYMIDVKKFIDLFEKQYQRRDILRAWREKVIPQNGKLIEGTEYELHGIGCRIYYFDREVDFDFGPENRIDGFDIWRLSDYIENRQDMLEKPSGEELKQEFNNLIRENIIEKIPNSNLYFFAHKDSL